MSYCPKAPGSLEDYAGGAVRAGYLLADGTAYSRATYAALFAAIGTIRGGGDGSTTFNVPDTRRRVTVGSGGAGTGTLGNGVGATGGEEAHLLAPNESGVAAHTHGAQDTGHAHQYLLLTGSGGSSAGSGSEGLAETATGQGNAQVVISAAEEVDAQAAHNNIQPSIVVLKVIKF